MRSRRTAEQPSQPSIPLILSRSPALSLSVPPPSFLPQLARSFTKSKFTAAISAASSQRVRSESSQFALRARKMYKKDDRSLARSPSFRYNYHHRLPRCSVGYSCRLNLLNGRLIISLSLSFLPGAHRLNGRSSIRHSAVCAAAWPRAGAGKWRVALVKVTPETLERMVTQ